MATIQNDGRGYAPGLSCSKNWASLIVLVLKDGTKYSIHTDSLCAVSDYFKTKKYGGFEGMEVEGSAETKAGLKEEDDGETKAEMKKDEEGESIKRIFHLPGEDDKESFGLLTKWIYRGGDELSAVGKDSNFYYSLARLYNVAGRFGISELQTDISNEFHRGKARLASQEHAEMAREVLSAYPSIKSN